MIRSMTGYGRAESTGYDWKCTVELKSVNHRYCDVSIRLPSFMNPYEEKTRKILTKEIKRGKIDAYIRIENLGHQPVKIELNTGVADAYVKAMHLLLERYTVPDQVTLSSLSNYPDVFTVDKSVTDEAKARVWVVLERTIKEATASLNAMRLAEGKALYGDILIKRTNIADFLKSLKQKLPQVVTEYEKRLRDRIAEVITKMAETDRPPDLQLDESRILVELALYADRVAVDEEVIRLESHMKQLDTIMAEEDSVGRKLDFLVQEMHREINTIGSKTNDVEISKLVIDIKSEIEKIREQVQNVE